MDFLKRENMLDDIDARIKASKLNLAMLKGGNNNSNGQIINHVQSLIEYLKKSKRTDNNARYIDFQINKLENLKKLEKI